MEREHTHPADDTSRYEQAAEMFALLSDATRVRVFLMLCHRQMCVGQVAIALGKTMSTASYQLKVLRGEGLLDVRREGKEIFYRAADTPAAALLHRMIESVMESTCPAGEGEGAHTPAAAARAVHDLLIEHPEKRYRTEELARLFFVGESTLKTAFRRIYGEPLGAHALRHRMEYAAVLLCEGGQTVASAALAVGYASESKFCAAFRKTMGQTPLSYRRKKQEGIAPKSAGSET